MKNIITIASYSILRYARKPLSLCVFLLTPIIMYAYVFSSSTTSTNYSLSEKAVHSSNIVHNNIITPDTSILQKNDKLCILYTLVFLFYYAILSGHSIGGDTKNGLLKRTITSPVTILQTLLGKLLGNTILMTIFIFFLVIISTYLFGVNWGPNLSLTVPALVLFALFVNGFGIFLSGISSSSYLCTIIVIGFDFLMAFPVFFSSYAPIKLPLLISILQKFSIHNYVSTAISASEDFLLYGEQIAILSIITLVTLITAMISGRRSFQ